jgi:hypothetical protein
VGEGKVVLTRDGLSVYLRQLSGWILGVRFASRMPTSQNRDMGHPALMVNQAWWWSENLEVVDVVRSQD